MRKLYSYLNEKFIVTHRNTAPTDTHTASTKRESGLLCSAPSTALSKTHWNTCHFKHMLNPFLNWSLKCSHYSFQPSIMTTLDTWGEQHKEIIECAYSMGQTIYFRLSTHTVFFLVHSCFISINKSLCIQDICNTELHYSVALIMLFLEFQIDSQL